MAFRDVTLKLLGKRGSDLMWLAAQRLAYPPDFFANDIALCNAVEGKTMTSPERIVGLAQAVRYVSANAIPGAFVECGVWRGGSMMAAAHVLCELGDTNRELVLFDTFEGMPDPTSRDVTFAGRPAAGSMTRGWCASHEEEVAANLVSTGYPRGRLRFVKGKVEETLPAAAPEQIALLRLDTDWYESTLHELRHLYPRLARGGVLIIDDYGHWQGAKAAVDSFFETISPRPLLARLDYTGRCCVKP